MRRFAILVALAGCTIPAGKDIPPVVGTAPIVVDPSSQTVSLDTSRVPVLDTCAAGTFVERTSSGWTCAAGNSSDPRVDDLTTRVTTLGTNTQDLPTEIAALQSDVTNLKSSSVTQDALADYVKTTDLTTDLSAYAKTSDLGSYAKTSDLSAYVTNSILTTDLAAYVKTSDLAAYAKISDLANYATKTDVQGVQAQVSGCAKQSDLDALTARVTALENANCPAGYTYDAATTSYIHCTKQLPATYAYTGSDEVVKVGDFWIDRFEAGACDGAWGSSDPSGNTTTIVACSIPNRVPSGGVNWFQAAQACANAGKRLCTNLEWQTAASGTPDPGDSSAATACLTSSTATAPRNTGQGSACISRFGAMDMIGNVWEWVGDWQQGTGAASNKDTGAAAGASLGGDGQYSVDPAPYQGSGQASMPSAMLRGGAFGDGTMAGAYTVSLSNAPTVAGPAIGFRCCLSR